MKRRAKDIGRKHKDIMFTNYKKLREQMNKIKQMILINTLVKQRLLWMLIYSLGLIKPIQELV